MQRIGEDRTMGLIRIYLGEIKMEVGWELVLEVPNSVQTTYSLHIRIDRIDLIIISSNFYFTCLLLVKDKVLVTRSLITC